jgi:murein DD-endopeptidase MepM/ murein hydrolase activator NlpD
MEKRQQQIVLGGLAVVGVVLAFLVIKKTFGKKLKASLDNGWMPPVTGRFTSGFGLRKDPLNTSKEQVHNGQDVAVPIGTAVKSPMSGVVKSTTSTEGGGNQVIILHDNGWFTGYAHLSKVNVNVGQKVSQGQVIALSGNTGAHTTAPHVHVTMTNPQGVKVDPKKYLYKNVA